MNLALFGATGGLGRAVLDLALARGLGVRAHARTPSVLPEHPALHTVHGDFADVDSIGRTLDGSDAVLSAIGYSKGQDPAIYGAGMRALVDAMHKRELTRLIAISGAGLELPGDDTPLSRRLIITALKLFSPKVLAGKEHEWAALRDTELDWTLVRVARMVDRPPEGDVSVDLEGVKGSPTVAYADVARWMLDQAQARTYVRQAPFVSGG